MKRYQLIFLLLSGLVLATTAFTFPDLTAKEIIEKADEKMRGETSKGAMTMKVVRPSWSREMEMKMWSKGTELSLILITGPARDEGTAFLKRKNEIWNWQPTIDRVIKLPPSMMMQSWMGSDFTNDDLIKESSIVKDYTHKLLGTEKISGYECYKIEMIPKENAAVVWGKILIWIDKEDFMQLKTEFYDEEEYLVNTMQGEAIKKMDDRMLPSRLIVTPADKEGHQTIIEYKWLKFNEPVNDQFFSTQNMKRVR